MNIIHKFVMLALISFGLTISAHSAEEVERPISVTLSSQVLNKYFDINGATWADVTVVQTDLTLSHNSSGVYIDIWHSTGADGTGWDDGAEDEVDWSLGWSGDVGQLNIDGGVVYYDLVGLFNGTAGDVVAPYLNLAHDFTMCDVPLTAIAGVRRNIPTDNSFDGGCYYTNGVQNSTTVYSVDISQESRVTYDDGAFNMESGYVWQHEVTVTKEVCDHVAVFLFGEVSVPLTRFDDRQSELVGGLGIELSF